MISGKHQGLQVLTELITNDFDELSACLDATEQAYRQIEAGQFHGRFRRIDLPGVHVTEEFMNRRITIHAAIPKSCLTMFIPVVQKDRLTLEGHDCFQNEIFLGMQGADAFMCLPSEIRCLSIELQTSAVRRMARAIGVCLPKLPQTSRLPDSRSADVFRKTIMHAQATVARNASSMNRLSAQRWSDRILSAFVEVLRESSGQPKNIDRTTLLQRRAAAMNVADYVIKDLAKPVALAEMCAVAGISERSLRNGFQDVFGVSPNRFIKTQRLSAARNDLKRAEANVDTVTKIATRWGFAQFAHFATDYRALFGEQPSETLRQTLT